MHPRPIWSGELTPEQYKQKRLADKRAEYHRNKEQYRATAKAKYLADKGKRSAISKVYYLKNRKDILNRVKDYRMNNAAAISAKRKAIYRPAKYRGYFLKFKYGMTVQQYEEMLLAQGRKCANEFCTHDGSEDKRNRPLFVDHCHATNKVRGLLCNRCNRVLGMLKESPDLIRGLANYIEGHK